MRTAKRIASLPPYLFASLDRKITDARARGIDVISLAIGDPDRPTPSHIVEAGQAALANPSTHQYPSYYGLPEFRESIAAYYDRRFAVTLDPATQILPLIGSKEGIAHLATAFVDPGDAVLMTDPGYPVYETSTILSGGRVIGVPMTAEDSFLPRFDSLDPQGAKALWLNYPNNPTAAVCDLSLFEQAVAFCAKHDVLLAHDAAYLEITYDGFAAPSALQVKGALDVAIEFGSLSKTYNMTGWRIGWVAGSAEAIEALSRVKTNIDSGVFNAVQAAGIAALEGPQECVGEMIDIYRQRRDLVVDALNSAGWFINRPKGSIYVWVPTPNGESSVGFCEFLLENAGVVCAPGSGYGKHGEGFVRFSLTVPEPRLDEAMLRITKALKQR
ncbi:MAG: LL-diaminopimelate aminotransferase [Actinomycetota bacterium]